MKALGFMTVLAACSAFSLSASAAGPVDPGVGGTWVSCSDSGIADASSLYAGTVTCGGDPTPSGGGISNVDLPMAADLVAAGIVGANPFNFYEVYWLAIGQAVTSAVKVGGFLTDCMGNTARSGKPDLLRDISATIDALTGTPVEFSTTVGSTTGAGVFLAYSRGPYSYDDPAVTCPWPTTFNTVNGMYDPDITAPLANPAVDLASDAVQYLSGFSH